MLYELGVQKIDELYNCGFTDNFSRRALIPVFIMVCEIIISNSIVLN